MRHLNENIPLFLTAIVTMATIVYTFYSILLWRATRAAAEISRQAALSNLWTELNRYIEILRNQNAADAGFMEKLSGLILEFMIANLLNESRAKNKETLEEFRRKIMILAEQHKEIAAKYPWVARLVEPGELSKHIASEDG
jgi:pilus assembly protein TadC